MKHEELFGKVRIEEEEGLLRHLEQMFNAPAITALLTYKDRIDKDNLLSSWMKGYYFPLSKKFGGDLYRTCREAQETLGLDEVAVEFYVYNNPEVNAFALYNHNEGEPHYIVLNSGLLDRLDRAELSFVVGHEFGHLLYRHSVFDRVLGMIYPTFEDLPPYLQGILDLWRKLAEMSADRVGLMAAKDIGPALRAMFKMSSGLSMTDFEMDASSYMELIEGLLKEMGEASERVFESHPANPVRVKALEIFFHSRTWKRWSGKKAIQRDEELYKAMEESTAILRKTPQADREQAELDLLAAAGYAIMASDGEVTPEEYNYLLNILSRYYFWPSACLEGYIEKKSSRTLKKTLARSAEFLLKNYPQNTRKLLLLLIPLLSRDKKVDQRELDAFFHVAVEHLQIPEAEAVDMVLEGLVENFRPMT